MPQGDGDRVRRAQVHAALGDVVRLAIVDQLAVADASPGELSAQHGLATNLLAHHLKVLESAGIIRRVRSEGDRRRSYIQLRWDDPTVAAVASLSTEELPAARVVFVCTHNSARSQLAAALWDRAHPVPAVSAGTHPAPRVHPRAVEVGRRHGLRLGRSRTAHVSEVLGPDDLVIAVCDNAHEELPASVSRLHWSVPDPARADTDEAFVEAYATLVGRIDRLTEAVTPA